MKRFLVPALLLLVLGLAPAACSVTRGSRRPPLPVEATRALAEAREFTRARPDGWLAQAEDAAARAQAAAPDWLAPKRVLDDLAREGWLGHEALAARRAALVPEATPAELYLVGRLEGQAGRARIERAARLDPELAWAQHGLAWHRFLAGEPRAALREGRRAVELARGSYELGQFAAAEARYLLELGQVEKAVARLEDVLAEAQLAEPERTELGVALALAELESAEPETLEQGFWRGVALLEGGRLAQEEYDRLGEALLALRGGIAHPDPLSELLAALEHGQGDGRERLRARVLAERGAQGLASLLWERAGGTTVSGGFRRARELERGAATRAVEGWLAALPARVRADDGLPREPSLRALVLAARASGDPASGDTQGAVRFGQALLAAGWFDEAESWAFALAEHDADAAFALCARAAAGQAMLASLRALLERVDEERPAFVPTRAGAPAVPRELDDLEALLEATQALLERFHGAPLAHALTHSPRLSIGGLASIVHPGPTFSARDERAGLGRAGEPVPGLAAELARLNRFGIFGQAPGGGGPDGTVLRRIGGEWKQGQHLGVEFAGWVAWCEGTDVASRPGRHGSSVSGAALHEGYWVDVEGVRRDWERVRALEREALAAEPERVARALESRGPLLGPGADAFERACWLAPLGEGERVLLAVLRERSEMARERSAESRVTLDELLELTALHEEGHLTDHTRFLPLTEKWPRALGFLLRHGLSPRAVARALEYRAQLVALCTAPEPRLALAECLAASDLEGGVLTHGEAYRELVEDLLRIAAREFEAFPQLSREHFVLYQLHHLSGEDVRALALRLAREEGLVESSG